MKKLVALLLINQAIGAQETAQILDSYVRQGLENNLVVKQREYSLQESLWALKEAKSMFFPDVSFNARYSVAEGGREIDLPVGELLNPVYSTLNELLQQNGQSPAFQTIENESFPFLRPTEQITKFRLTQPIVNPDIYYNRKMKQEKYHISEQELAQYKRELKAKIKIAYFNYLKSEQLLSLLRETKKLVAENRRVSKKLYEQGVITEDAVWRSKAEVHALQARVAEARKNHNLSRSYFNFLLNRDLDKPIRKGEHTFPLLSRSEEVFQQEAIERREELQIIEHQLKAGTFAIKMAKGAYYPILSAAVDYGIQGENYQIDEHSDFAMASLVLTWDLFTGGQHKARKMQAKVQKQKALARRQEVQQQIRLQVREYVDNTQEKSQRYEAKVLQEKQTKEAYRITRKRYSLGQASQVELVDARTVMTNASVNRIMARYDYYMSIARLEKVTSLDLMP